MKPGEGPGAKGDKPEKGKLDLDDKLKERVKKLKERAAKLRAEGKERAADGLEKQADRLADRTAGEPNAARSKANRDKIRKARKLARVKLLQRRYGEHLKQGDVRQEVQVHARRSANLSRMKALVSARTDDDTKQELLKRINRLMAKENARHSRTMAKLTKGKDKLAGKKQKDKPEKDAVKTKEGQK
jgi:hypothetical protein